MDASGRETRRIVVSSDMKKLLAFAAAGVMIATPALARQVPIRGGWNLDENSRLQIAPSDWVKGRVPVVNRDDTITVPLIVVWQGNRHFSFDIAHKGNTCARPEMSGSALSVCVDKSYYVITPRWKSENRYKTVTLDCDRHIKIRGKNLLIRPMCDTFK